MSLRDRAPDLLAGLMATVGSLHFVVPGTMAETIPAAFPRRRELVLVSGVVEIGCAIGLRRRVRGVGPFTALTLLAIWPANIQMALDAGSGKNPGPMDDKRLMWARVPLQLPLIWAALQARPRA
jgi:uncharacterized membrane protein